MIIALLAMPATACTTCNGDVSREKARTAGVLVLGDSQISFGAGQVFQEFFNDVESRCSTGAPAHPVLEALGAKPTAAIGVRSTSLHSWVARQGSAKGTICDIDAKYGVNAGTYGISKRKGRSFVQIGQGNEYQFCQQGRSAFEAMFRDGYYDPKLLLLTFLGNSAERWADEPGLAMADVRETVRQIPAGMACVFVTTAPSYLPEVNDLRQRAQHNIKAAFARHGRRCSFVGALTDESRSVTEGNKTHFRTSKAGKVKDPYHPKVNAVRTFVALNTPGLCDAVVRQLAH